MRHKDGTYRWMLSRGTAVRDQAGKAIRLVGNRVDITELKRVEEVLREAAGVVPIPGQRDAPDRLDGPARWLPRIPQ